MLAERTITILHLFWIIPLSMAIGAMILLCCCMILALREKREDQKDCYSNLISEEE